MHAMKQSGGARGQSRATTPCRRPFKSCSRVSPPCRHICRATHAPQDSAIPRAVGAATSSTRRALLGAAGLLLGGGALHGQSPALAVNVEQLLFLEAWRAVDRAYVDKTFNGQTWFKVRETFLKQESFASRDATYAAIRKLLASLDDPFTRFLEPERLSALRRGTKGSVTGVGVEVTFDSRLGANSELVVIAPAPGGPAEQGGVRAGDVIVAVDGRPTAGLSLYEASDLLQGASDSQVTLALRPPGSKPGAAARSVTLTRRPVSVSPVTYRVCEGVAGDALPAGSSAPGRVGYLRIATFNGNTLAAAREALQALDSSGVDAIALDIRNNGGGLFPAGVGVAQLLIRSGDIVLIADAGGVRDIYSADGRPLDATTPLAVLVNRGTASASEVLAGALKDNKRATIVGEPTFGKGLIQTVVELSDGSGVAVTVARYQTPGGVDINRVGIAPDVRLDPGALPLEGGDLCRLLASPAAPALFAAAR